MKKRSLISILVSGLLLLNFISYGQEEVNKTFDAKEMIKISTISGDCKVYTNIHNTLILNEIKPAHVVRLAYCWSKLLFGVMW